MHGQVYCSKTRQDFCRYNVDRELYIFNSQRFDISKSIAFSILPNPIKVLDIT